MKIIKHKSIILILIPIFNLLIISCDQTLNKNENSTEYKPVIESENDSLLTVKLDSIKLLIENKKSELFELQHTIKKFEISNEKTKKHEVEKQDTILKEQIQQLSYTSSNLKSEKKRLLKKIDSLSKINTISNKILKNKSAELEKALFLKNKYEEEISNLKQEKNILEENLKSSKSLNISYKQSIDTYNNQLNSLNSEIEKEQNNKSLLEIKIETLQKQLEEAKTDYKKSNNRDSLIEQKITVLTKEKSEANTLLLQANNTISALQKKLTKVEDSLMLISNKNKKLENALHADKMQKNKLIQQYDSLQNLINVNRIKIGENNKSNTVNDNAVQIVNQLDSLKKELNNTTNKLNSTENLLILKKKQLVEKEAALSNQKELTNKLIYVKDSLETNLKKLIRVNDSLNKAAKQLKKENVTIAAKHYDNTNHLIKRIDSLNEIMKITSLKLDSLQKTQKKKAKENLQVSKTEKFNNYHLLKIKDSLEINISELTKRNDSLKILLNKVKELNSSDSAPVNSSEDNTVYFPLNTYRTKIKLTNKIAIEKYLERYIEAYLKRKSSLEFFSLKEYFFFYIDTLGSIVKIEDQRTAFNKNTKIFKKKDIDSLKNMQFKPVVINGKKTNVKAAIGVEINMQQTKYEYRLQKNKIRVYKTPLYVEYVEPGDDDYKIISDALSKYSKITNKFYITIIKGDFSVNEYAQKEYNPFEKVKSVLLKQEVLKITNIRGIR